MRKRVYIAGPITRGDLEHNVNQATAAFVALAKAGFAPLCPHWSVYAKPAWTRLVPNFPAEVYCQATRNGNDEMSHDDWVGLDLEWVKLAHCVLRLPGESTGADEEVRVALEHGVPIYYSVDAILCMEKPDEL